MKVKFFIVLMLKVFFSFMFSLNCFAQNQPGGNNTNNNQQTSKVKLAKKLEQNDINEILNTLEMPTFNLNLQFNFSPDDFDTKKYPTLDEEIKKLELTIKKETNNPQNFLKLGFAYNQKKDYQNARLNYEKAVKLFEGQINSGKETYDIYFGLAEVQQYLGNTIDALEYFLKAADLDRKKAEPYVRCAYLAFSLNQDFKTINHYLEKALKREPENIDILIDKNFFILFNIVSAYSRGDKSLIQKPIDEIIDLKTLNNKISAVKENQKYQIKLAITEFFYLFMKFMALNLDKLPQGFKNLTVLSNNSDIMTFQQSKNIIEDAIKEKSADLSMLYNAMGCINLIELNTKKAEKFFLKALEVNPYRDEVYYNLAVFYYLENQLSEILNIINNKMKLYSSVYDYLILAKVYFKTNDLDNALKQSLKLVELYPNSPSGYLYVAIVYLKANKLKESESYLIKSMQIKPSADGYFTYGVLALLVDQPDKAYQFFLNCVNLDPTYDLAKSVAAKYLTVK